MRSIPTRNLIIILPVALLLTACDGGSSDGPPPPPPDIINAPPIAAAGSDLTVMENSTVLLDGSASRDIDGTIKGRTWAQISGVATSLATASAAKTTFRAPEVTGNADHVDLVFELTVTDDGDLEDADEIAVRVFDANRRPSVVIDSAATSGIARQQVFADASGSSDADGSIVTYAWEQVSGTTGTIANADTAVATITLPDVTEEELITYHALVTDNEGKVGIGEYSIFVRPEAYALAFRDLTGAMTIEVDTIWPALRIEVRNANGDRIQRGDPSALEITLVLQPGTGTGVLAGTLTRQAFQGVAVFNDLSYNVAEAGLVLRAFADGDSVEGLSPVIDVVLTNQPPAVQADASATTVDALTADVQLLGTAADADGSITNQYWTQVSGPSVDLTDAHTPTATFDAPDVTAPRALVFRFSATDNGGKSRNDDVSVIVNPVAARVAFLSALRTPVAEDGVWSGVDIEIQNTAGDRITGGAPATYTVHLSVQAGNPADLTGTIDIAAVTGLASFIDLRYIATAGSVILAPSVASPALTGAPSNSVTVLSKLPGAIGSPGAAVWFNGAAADGGDGTFFGGGFNTGATALDFGFAPTGDTRSSVGESDGFVARYTADGGLLWVRTFGGADASAQVMDVATSGVGDAVLVAQINGPVDFDDDPVESAIPPVHGDEDVVLASLDGATGELNWAVSFGDDLVQRPTAVAFRSATGNTAVVSGAFEGNDVGFEPCTGVAELSSGDHQNGFVASFDTDVIASACSTTAATDWIYTPALAGGDNVINDVHVVGSGIYVAGTFSGAVEFKTGEPRSPTAPATAHAVVMELDATNGEPLWVHTFGGDLGTTTANAIANDADGNIYIAGTFRGTGDFDPGTGTHTLSSNGGDSGYVISFSAVGAFRPEVAVGFGGSGAADTVAIKGLAAGPTAGDGVVLTGTIWGTVDVDPEATSSTLLSTRTGESNGFALGLTASGQLDFIYEIGATEGTIGLDAACGALVVTHPGAGLTITLSGRAGGMSSPYDVDPTAGVRDAVPAGNLDATLAVIVR